MHPLLKKTHFGKHVANYEGRLIDVDVDYDTLTRRIDFAHYERQRIDVIGNQDTEIHQNFNIIGTCHIARFLVH